MNGAKAVARYQRMGKGLRQATGPISEPAFLSEVFMILDHKGKPIDMGAIRERQSESDDLSRVGALTREFANHPGRGLTPARLNSILQEAEHGDLLGLLDLADDMEERDGNIFSQMSVRKTAVIKHEWAVHAPTDASKAEKMLADEVSEWLDDIPAFEDDVLLELLDGILKGFKPIEMWWELDQRTLQPRFESAPQRWLTLDERGRELRFRNGAPWGVPLRPFNWIVHQPRARSGYPSRASLARVLAWPFLFLNYATRDLAEFLEIYGLPLRIGKYPSGASDAEKRRLLQAVVQVGHNAAGIIPAGMSIDFEAAAQGTEKPFQVMMSEMRDIESKVIVGQTLTSGEGQHGTQALGSVHNEVRLDILSSDAKRLARTITHQLVRPMLLLNKPGLDPRRLPEFVIDVPEPDDLQLYADALPKLAKAGMRISVSGLHDRLRIPMAGPDEAVLTGGDGAGVEPPAGGQGGVAERRQAPASAALAAQVDAGQRDALDDLVADAVQDWRPVMEPMIQPLLDELDAAVARGESLADFRARLPMMIEQMDATPQAERMARAAFLARLLGEADIDPGTPAD
jgi:phage gp29-like protein